MENKLQNIIKRYQKAKAKKDTWESVWQECYAYAFPQREGGSSSFATSAKIHINLFDGTAPDAVDQLASSMLAELTPPWAKWFGLKSGIELSDEEKEQIAPILDKTTQAMLQNFEHSNFAVEIHQCYLDLVTAGTACLMFEEAPIGDATAYSFTAIPLKEIALEQSPNGRIDTTFRATEMSIEEIQSRFPEAQIPLEFILESNKNDDYKLMAIEYVAPRIVNGGRNGYEYIAIAWNESKGEEHSFVLKEGVFDTSPFINFRWLKAPGEVYGRSPVMKALPDIKTANKVVELILKNASISVTGIWQAEDDGVLNPANIKLVPGAIIPKAVGSKGLTPLEAPGKFDVSQIVLQDLRTRINHSLLADRLAQIDGPTMTATEVMERSAEVMRILGASFGRLQSELLTPLLKRAFHILRRRGDIMNFDLDGKIVDLQYKSPLAQYQAKKDVGNISEWLTIVSAMGQEAICAVDMFETAKWIGNTLSIPAHLIKDTKPDNIIYNETN